MGPLRVSQLVHSAPLLGMVYGHDMHAFAEQAACIAETEGSQALGLWHRSSLPYLLVPPEVATDYPTHQRWR